MKKISYIIPCYNSGDTIKFCVDSIFAQTGNFEQEIIIIDSSKKQRIKNIIKNFSENIQYIYSKKRLFPGEARNLGLEYYSGNYIAFIDSDVILNEHWTSRMLNEHNRISRNERYNTILGGAIKNSSITDTYLMNTIFFIEFYDIMPSSKNGYRNKIPTANMFLSATTMNNLNLKFPKIRMAEDIFFLQRRSNTKYKNFFSKLEYCYSYYKSFFH